MPVGQTLDEFIQQQERGYIEATLSHCGGSREKAASMLGISMATLYRKIEPKKKVEPLQLRFVYILIWSAAFCSSSNVSSAVFCLFKISSFAALKSRSALRLLAVVSVAAHAGADLNNLGWNRRNGRHRRLCKQRCDGEASRSQRKDR